MTKPQLVSIDMSLLDTDELAPLYVQSQGQRADAYLAMDESGNAYLTTEWPHGGPPIEVFTGRTLKWPIDCCCRGARLRKGLNDERTMELLDAIHAGHSSYSDGPNIVGRLTEAASRASEALQNILDACGECEPVAVVDASDWLWRSSIAESWPSAEALDDAVRRLEIQARSDDTQVEKSDLRRTLLEKLVREYEDGHVVELVEQHRVAIESVSPYYDKRIATADFYRSCLNDDHDGP